MKALLRVLSGVTMIVLMSSCSNDGPPIVGPGTNIEPSNTSTLNFTVKDIVLGEGMLYSQDIIVLSKTMDGDVLVEYEVESTSCEDGVDYSITTPNPCCIPAGENRAAFTIETFTDKLNEGDEVLFVKLVGADNLQHGGDVALGESVILRITICDHN